MSDRLRESLRRMKSEGAKAVGLAGGGPVRFERFPEASELPLLARPAVPDLDPVAWAAGQREAVFEQLGRSGGLLFRGFALRSVEEFEAFCRALVPSLMDYTEKSTPRSGVSGKVYTSTEYPPDQVIPFHNELSYASRWPRTIWFFCLQPAARGGETPIADSRRVYQGIDPAVRERFARRQVLYVRNFGRELGLPWQEVFDTSDPAVVEERCRAAGIELEWRSEGRLRTRAVRPAVARHPRTGEDLWFNQAHLHHASSLPAETRAALLEVVPEDELPFNTYYGDGAPIEEEALDEVRRAYDQVAVRFPWQRGDLLMLDNMLVAHGRQPYTGERKVTVAMSEV